MNDTNIIYLIVVAFVGPLLTALIGAVVGGLLTRVRNERKHDREEQAHVTSTIQQLVWAVGGAPATEISPARPGLVGLVDKLTDRLDDHEEWHERERLGPANKEWKNGTN